MLKAAWLMCLVQNLNVSHYQALLVYEASEIILVDVFCIVRMFLMFVAKLCHHGLEPG